MSLGPCYPMSLVMETSWPLSAPLADLEMPPLIIFCFFLGPFVSFFFCCCCCCALLLFSVVFDFTDETEDAAKHERTRVLSNYPSWAALFNESRPETASNNGQGRYHQVSSHRRLTRFHFFDFFHFFFIFSFFIETLVLPDSEAAHRVVETSAHSKDPRDEHTHTQTHTRSHKKTKDERTHRKPSARALTARSKRSGDRWFGRVRADLIWFDLIFLGRRKRHVRSPRLRDGDWPRSSFRGRRNMAAAAAAASAPTATAKCDASVAKNPGP